MPQSRSLDKPAARIISRMAVFLFLVILAIAAYVTEALGRL